MELQEMLEVQPKDYIKEGFLTESGTVREELNGFCSLAMAYHLREEGMTPESARKVLEEMILLAGLRSREEAVREIGKNEEFRNSVSLKSLTEVAAPWITDPQQWEAFINHFRRIIAQLALISAIPAVQETHSE